MKNIDSIPHLRGASVYLDDVPVQQGTLYGCVFDSPVAHGQIRKLDLDEAIRSEGVVRIFTAKDIPGENHSGGWVPGGVCFGTRPRPGRWRTPCQLLTEERGRVSRSDGAGRHDRLLRKLPGAASRCFI